MRGLAPALTAAILLLGLACQPLASAAAARPPGQSSPAPSPAAESTVAHPLASLTPEQRVGQLFMVGVRSGADQAEAAQTAAAIGTAHVGNVVLYGNGWSSSQLVRSTTRALQQVARDANAGVRLLVSGNQEGGEPGVFQAFYGEGFAPLPSATVQAQGDPGRLEEQARGWGAQLRDAGVNLNLAPVLDVVPAGTAAANDPIGHWDREYGSTPEEVTAYGLAFARGMRAAPVAVAVKHFPGLGRVQGNTDFTTAGIVDDQLGGADDPYLRPYRAAIAEGVELVMVSLAVYPGVDARQAVFSPVILKDILRGQLGFRNVVISDDLGAAAAVADRLPAQRALDFFRAGGDLLLTVRASDVAPMTQAVLSEMAADADFRADLDASLARVLRVKAALGLLPAAQ